jgi:cytochrome c556
MRKMNRRTSILSAFAALLFTLSLSSAASAQYQRDRDQRRRDDDNYGRNNSGYGRYDDRALRDAAQRIKDRAHRLENDVDRFLDNSRANGTRREDQVNAEVQDFRRAADNFKSRVGNGRDANRSSNEVRQLLSAGDQVDRMLNRLRVDLRTYADWREIEQDLRFVADVYGVRYNGGNGNNRSGGYDPRYPDNRNGRTNTNDGWWRRIPDVINGRRP